MIVKGELFISKKQKIFGIWIFTALSIIFALYYYYPLYSSTYEYMYLLTSFTIVGIITYIDIILTILLIFSATYGFYYKKNWSRLIVIIVLLFSSFWAIISMFIWRWQIIEHYFYFIFYIIFLMYFNLSWVKDYFKSNYKKEDNNSNKSNKFIFNGYTLYKNEVETKKGNKRIFYFFSKDPSNKGIPCKKPEGYIIKLNKLSGVPYLKKEE